MSMVLRENAENGRNHGLFDKSSNHQDLKSKFGDEI